MTDPPEDHARRDGGARREMSDPVVLYQGARRIDGWALNVSRGGLRAILDESVEVGEDFDISLGETDVRRAVRVVWVRAEKGGSIVGVAFKDVAGSVPPPSLPPPVNPLASDDEED